MPNIAITTYCNLHCPYCFADTMINTEDIKNISLEQFQSILNWLEKDDKACPSDIGLIGGEPTLHPQFREILSITDNFISKHNGEGTLFTNGVYLEQYIAHIPEKFTILLNVNTPTAMSKSQWDGLQKTLRKLHLIGWLDMPWKVTIGCNICMEIDDYDFLWNIVDQYKISHVRVSVTAPTKEEYKNNKDLYYTSMIPKFLNFVKEADKRHITLGRDCNYIPYCYYENIEDLELVKKIVLVHPHDVPHCGPIVDITPEFTATSCFGAYEPVSCLKFDNYSQLTYYLANACIMPKFRNNNTGKCQNCEQHQLMLCQGGCLAFAQKNL